MKKYFALAVLIGCIVGVVAALVYEAHDEKENPEAGSVELIVEAEG